MLRVLVPLWKYFMLNDPLDRLISAHKIHISESIARLLETIGGFTTTERGLVKVKVCCLKMGLFCRT